MASNQKTKQVQAISKKDNVKKKKKSIAIAFTQQEQPHFDCLLHLLQICLYSATQLL